MFTTLLSKIQWVLQADAGKCDTDIDTELSILILTDQSWKIDVII